MRALVIHQFYRSSAASGENLSVRDEVDALRRRGHEVTLVRVDSDALIEGMTRRRAARLALQPTWSSAGRRLVAEAVARHRPQVALLENLFPSFSPAVVPLLHEAGVPVLAAVRNYKMVCAASTLFRDGHECLDCVGSALNLPAAVHRCYQGSTLASLSLGVALRVHRPTFSEIDHFLPVSGHVAGYLRGLGIPPGRITVRPNFVRDPGVRGEGPGRGIAVAGRLSEDKGVGLLLEAWERCRLGPDVPLVVVGSGPLEERAREVGRRRPVELLGLLGHAEAIARMATSRAIVVPSLWHEPFGRVAIEAASVGRPAVVLPRGGLTDIVVDGETGWVADADPASLAQAIEAAADPDEAVRRGRAARARYERHYTEERSIDVLEEVLERHRLLDPRPRRAPV